MICSCLGQKLILFCLFSELIKGFGKLNETFLLRSSIAWFHQEDGIWELNSILSCFFSFFCCQSTDIKYSVYVIWFDQICFTFPIYRPIKLYYLNIPNKQTQPRLWMSSWRENKKLVSIKLFDKSKKISSALMVLY